MLLATINTLCKQNSITVTELERILEFGNGTIHKWDKGKPAIDKVIKVAEYFSVGVDDLIHPERRLSIDASRLAKEYDTLSDDKKDLVRCYISIIKNQTQATCTTCGS
jgi:hypothetical protein